MYKCHRIMSSYISKTQILSVILYLFDTKTFIWFFFFFFGFFFLFFFFPFFSFLFFVFFFLIIYLLKKKEYLEIV
ncbi:unnamed protein product, partial [Vitis vinifera]|uniref:Uncharacterized protein n=1 Tax=Vitis vinifera TaxID=29760 RepID=D7TFZ5_VITVI